MRPRGIGGKLFREGRRPLGVLASALIVFMLALVVALAFLANSVDVLLAFAAVVLYPLLVFLFKDEPSAVFERGVALRVSPWNRILHGRRRWVLAEEMQSFWPVYRYGANEPRRLIGYEMRFPGGKGRVFAGRVSRARPLPDQWLTQALRRMMADRWEATLRAGPGLTAEEAAQLKATLSRSYREPMRLARRLVNVTLGAVGFILFLLLVSRPPGGFELWWWLTGILGGLVLALGTYEVLQVQVPRAAERIDAFATFRQIREDEPEIARDMLPDLRLHPDYMVLDPNATEDAVDFVYMRETLADQNAPFVLFLAGVGMAALGVALTWFYFDLSIIRAIGATLIVLLSGGLLAVPGSRQIRELGGAHSYLLEKLREEWRTGKQVLPPDYEIPKGFRTFRTPPDVSEATARRMRLGVWAETNILTRLLPFLAIAGFLVLAGAALAFDLGKLLAPFLLPVGLIPVLAWLALKYWTVDSLSLLGQLRDYESASGKRALPPDLSVIPKKEPDSREDRRLY